MSCEVELAGITVTFPATEGPRQVLNGLDLVAQAGRVTTVMGDSGGGKTTLLRVVAGLQEAEAGEVFFDGESVSGRSPKDRNVAMAFQNYALYPGLNVARNLELPLQALNVVKAERRRRVSGILEKLGITDLAHQGVNKLSGGEQQRVALGRALIRRPKVLLLDEPLSNVDPGRQQQIVKLLHDLFEEYRPTTLLVTHDWNEARLLSDRIAVLDRGNVVQCGPPAELYRQPANLKVLNFTQQATLNEISGLECISGNRRLVLPGSKISATSTEPLGTGRFRAIFRPEHLRTDSAGWYGHVRSVCPTAGVLLVELDAAGRRWSCITDPTASPEPGATLRVTVTGGEGWIANEQGCFLSRLESLEVGG